MSDLNFAHEPRVAEVEMAEAEATGFRPDMLEKVAHLLGLLDALRSHPFLRGKADNRAMIRGIKCDGQVNPEHHRKTELARDSTKIQARGMTR